MYSCSSCFSKSKREFHDAERHQIVLKDKRMGRCEERLYMVGERCMRDEVAAEAAVECIEVRMPE